MAGPNLPTNVSGGSSSHLAHHNTLHQVANRFDNAGGAAGQTLAWDNASSTWVASSPPAFNARSYGANPAAADNRAAIQAALDAADAAGGGRVYLPQGRYKVLDTVFVPTKVVLEGAGRGDTGIQAGATFPTTGAPLVRLGRAVDSLVFGCRVERMMLDCDSKAAVALYSNSGNEMSGASYLLITNVTDIGIHLFQASGVNFDNLEVYPKTTGANKGIYLQNVALDNLFQRVTIGVNGLFGVGIDIFHTKATLIGIHIETCTVGIDLKEEGVATMFGIDGGTINNDVPVLIRTYGNTHSSAMGVTRQVAPVAIRDVYNGIDYTDSFIPFWSGRQIVSGTIRHTGDLVGFFNRTPVGRPTVTGATGGNAALNSLVDALFALGLINDSTT